MNFLIISLIFALFVLVLAVFFLLGKINSSLNKNLIQAKDDFNKHLFESQSTLQSVAENIANLKNVGQKIEETGKDIQKLQDIFKSPKLRGGFGEFFLEKILTEILPSNSYKLQYKFQTGNIVDAVVKFKDSKLLCIDAKFPLNSIKDYLSKNQSSDDLPTQFLRDIKKHIDDISRKYILPIENTMDFALMYIPAESIYYEIILKDEQMFSYCMDKHVVPVSPISLYSYLSTVVIGLKGMEVEKNAKEILVKLSDMKNTLSLFLLEFERLGGHLNNAKSKYDQAKESILKMEYSLNKIELSSIDDKENLVQL